MITFHWICSVMKIYLFYLFICCVPAQIPYLWKFWFLRYEAKCFQPFRLQDFSINHVSRTSGWNSLISYMLIQIGCISRMNWRNNWFSACWCKFRKVKSYFSGSWLGLVKKRCGHWMSEWVVIEWVSESAEWISGLDKADFLYVDCDAIIFG